MFVSTRLAQATPEPAAAPLPVPPPAGLFDRLRRYRPGSSVPRVMFYECGRAVILTLLTLLYRFRVYGGRRFPQTGGVLVVANHQSYFDAPVLGAAAHCRQLDYLARSATFKFPPLAFVIRLLNAISIKEDRGDAGAIKTVIKRLEEGGAVLMFPEGARTEDGRMAPLKRGIGLLVKRAPCPVIPLAIEGAFDAWPKGQLLPNFIGKRIEVAVGKPIPHEELVALGPDASLERIGDEIDRMRMALRRRLRRETGGRYPSRGAGDLPRRR